jgi:hypothetical protein
MGQVINKFEFERETKSTAVFVRENGSGRKESQYVQKSLFDGDEIPETIEVVVKW